MRALKILAFSLSPWNVSLPQPRSAFEPQDTVDDRDCKFLEIALLEHGIILESKCDDPVRTDDQGATVEYIVKLFHQMVFLQVPALFRTNDLLQEERVLEILPSWREGQQQELASR